MEIHIARDGKQLGAFSLEEAQRKLNAGEVHPEDLAWTPGAAGWAALQTIPGIQMPANLPSARNVPPPLASPMGVPPYMQRQVAPTSGLAVASLVLGILSLTVVPFLASIPAVVCGHMARKEIRNSEGQMEGDGLAIGGLITGYLSLIGTVLIIGIMLLFFGFTLAAFANVARIEGKSHRVEYTDMDSKAVGKRISEACQDYAAQNDGLFPPTLAALVPTYLPDSADLMEHGTSNPAFVYVGGKKSDLPSKVLFYSVKKVEREKRVVGRVDGSVALVPLPPELMQPEAP